MIKVEIIIELKTSGACFFNAPTRLNPATNTLIPDRPVMLLFFRPDCKISLWNFPRPGPTQG